jgi:hypothetical protein
MLAVTVKGEPEYNIHICAGQSEVEESLLCYLTVLKCHLPASTYATPAITVTRPNALLSSPIIQDISRNFLSDANKVRIGRMD